MYEGPTTLKGFNMSYPQEKFNSNFNSDNIIKELNKFASTFGNYHQVDIVPYLVNATLEERREDFRKFISHETVNSNVSIDYILIALLQARMIQGREYIEALMREEDEFISTIKAHEWGLNDSDSSEESYW